MYTCTRIIKIKKLISYIQLTNQKIKNTCHLKLHFPPIQVASLVSFKIEFSKVIHLKFPTSYFKWLISQGIQNNTFELRCEECEMDFFGITI